MHSNRTKSNVSTGTVEFSYSKLVLLIEHVVGLLLMAESDSPEDLVILFIKHKNNYLKFIYSPFPHVFATTLNAGLGSLAHRRNIHNKSTSHSFYTPRCTSNGHKILVQEAIVSSEMRI